jgi:hypothetical protein
MILTTYRLALEKLLQIATEKGCNQILHSYHRDIFYAYNYAMTDKLNTIELLLQSKDENIWSMLSMCLSKEFKPLDYGKSLIPKSKIKELHKMNDAHER